MQIETTKKTVPQQPEDKPYKSLLRHLMPKIETITPRIYSELEVIKAKNWAPFYLTLLNFNHVEGSIAGSVVAYKLGITQIDPEKYNLPFTGLKSGIKGESDLRVQVDQLPNPWHDVLQKEMRYRRVAKVTESPLTYVISIDNLKNHIKIKNLPDLRWEIEGNATQLLEDNTLLSLTFETRMENIILKKLNKNLIEIDYSDFDDELTYALFSEGRTTGLYDWEDERLQQALIQLNPQRFNELLALYILSHTGRTDEIDLLVENKQSSDNNQYEQYLEAIFYSVNKAHYASRCFTTLAYAGIKATQPKEFLKELERRSKDPEKELIKTHCESIGIRIRTKDIRR